MKRAMKTIGYGGIAGAVLALVAMPALAQGTGMATVGGFSAGAPGGLFAQDFAALDADGNGLISEDDLSGLAQASLAEADSDGSGTLSIDELAAQMVARVTARQEARAQSRTGAQRQAQILDPSAIAMKAAERMLAARDGNGDGVLSLVELGPQSGFGRVIDRYDTDDDNALSQAEYDAVRAELNSRMAARDTSAGGRSGWHGNRGGRANR
jgi:hypothetical protein